MKAKLIIVLSTLLFVGAAFADNDGVSLSLIHISEPTRLVHSSRMPSSA